MNIAGVNHVLGCESFIKMRWSNAFGAQLFFFLQSILDIQRTAAGLNIGYMCDVLLSSVSLTLYLPVWEAEHRDVTPQSGGGVAEDGFVCVDGVWVGEGWTGESECWGHCTCSP